MEEEYNDFLQEVIAVIDECYEPVEHLRELDVYLTTDDIHDAIQALYPGEFYSGANTAELLKQAGFRFTALPTGQLQFVWLMRRR